MCARPSVFEPANTIISFAPHVAPRRVIVELDNVKVAPPLTETFFKLLSERKPIHCPSGEKKGPEAPRCPLAAFLRRRPAFARKAAECPCCRSPHTQAGYRQAKVRRRVRLVP